jgi:hypothetical protein
MFRCYFKNNVVYPNASCVSSTHPLIYIDTSGKYSAMEPGAIPVATPVPEVLAQQQRFEQYTPQYTPQKASAPLVMNPTTAFQQADPTLARVPMFINQCPNCRQESRTRISTYPTWQTWTASGVMLLVFWPICWVPLVLENCKQTDHYCVLCQTQVGKVDAFQDCCVTERA